MKAFIGHSFDPKDKDVVSRFLAFLNPLFEEILTGEEAESKSVAQKVKERICECEVFISLFTIDRPLYQNGKFGFLKGKVIGHTTSNWVLQELGYAVGTNKRIIVLIEEDLHRFPNLHSDDTEVIYFRRSSLEKAFQRVLEMVTAIINEGKAPIPNSGMDQAAVLEEEADAIQLTTEAKGSDEKEERSDAFLEIFAAIQSKDFAAAKQIFKTKLRPLLHPDEVLEWEATILRMQNESGNQSAFTELEDLAKKNPTDPRVQFQLGIRYQQMGAFRQAEGKYLESLHLYDLSKDDARKDYLYHRYKLADCYCEEGNYQKGLDVLIDDANNDQFKDFKNIIFKYLANLSHKNTDSVRFIFFAEAALDLNPNEIELRFNLAFAYSKNAENGLALLHYQRLLKISANHGFGLNNLAVAYSRLEMQAKSISFFKKAAEEKNTLAMANLADKYIQIGALEDARKQIDNANKIAAEGVSLSPNIGYSLRAIEQNEENENKLEKETLIQAEVERNFRVESAFLLVKTTNAADISGQWVTPWGKISLETNGKSIKVDGWEKIENYELSGKKYDNVFMSMKGTGELLGATIKMNFKATEVFVFEPHAKNIETKKHDGELAVSIISKSTLKILRKNEKEVLVELWDKI